MKRFIAPLFATALVVAGSIASADDVNPSPELIMASLQKGPELVGKTPFCQEAEDLAAVCHAIRAPNGNTLSNIAFGEADRFIVANGLDPLLYHSNTIVPPGARIIARREM